MIWAFILSVIYVPGWIGAAIPTGWAFISLTVPVLIWRGPALPRPLQILGLSAIAFAFLSLAWAPLPTFAIYTLWLQFCLGLIYILGVKLPSLEAIRKGLALGLSVSSLLCIVQYLGWNPVLQYDPTQPSGLLFNPSIAGAAFGLAVLWLALHRNWRYIPALLPGLALNHTRTVWAMLAATALVWIARNVRYGWLGLCAAIAAVAWYLFHVSPHDSTRVQLWTVIYEHLYWFGHGPGILNYITVRLGDLMARPEYAHNEYLDFIAQYGIGAAPIFVLAAIPLLAWRNPDWYVYVAFLSLALFSYPLRSVPVAVIGLILAGHLSRDWAVVRANLDRCRLVLPAWCRATQWRNDRKGAAIVSV